MLLFFLCTVLQDSKIVVYYGVVKALGDGGIKVDENNNSARLENVEIDFFMTKKKHPFALMERLFDPNSAKGRGTTYAKPQVMAKMPACSILGCFAAGKYNARYAGRSTARTTASNKMAVADLEGMIEFACVAQRWAEHNQTRSAVDAGTTLNHP